MSQPDQKNKNVNQSEKPLLTMTDSAIAKIKSMMEKEGKVGYALRVGVKTGGCAGLYGNCIRLPCLR